MSVFVSSIKMRDGSSCPIKDNNAVQKSELVSDESGDISVKTHSKGTLINWKGHTYVVKQSINVGDTISDKISESYAEQADSGYLNDLLSMFDLFFRWEVKTSREYSISANGQTTVTCDPPSGEVADLYTWHIMNACTDNLSALDVVGIYDNMRQVSVRSYYHTALTGRFVNVCWLGIKTRTMYPQATE